MPSPATRLEPEETPTRILIAGAGGLLGRATLPHLREHEVVGLTRHRERIELIERLGAKAVVCDVYELDALVAVAEETRPQIVVNFLTALTVGADANNRVRREGAANVRIAAEAVSAKRLVVESVAFSLADDAGRAVEELERATREFPGEALVLRFGRFWGPGTEYDAPPRPPAIHVSTAGARAAKLTIDGAPGIHVVANAA